MNKLLANSGEEGNALFPQTKKKKKRYTRRGMLLGAGVGDPIYIYIYIIYRFEIYRYEIYRYEITMVDT